MNPFASMAKPCTWLIALAAITISFMGVLLYIGPEKIVALELAGSTQAATDFCAPYAPTYSKVKNQLYVDFGFIAAYSTTLALACFLGAEACRSQRLTTLATLGMGIAWLQWVAGGLDAAENIALLNFLADQHRPLWPALARICAIAKFVLAILGCLYGAYGLWIAQEKATRICYRIFTVLLLGGALLFGASLITGLSQPAQASPPAQAGSEVNPPTQ